MKRSGCIVVAAILVSYVAKSQATSAESIIVTASRTAQTEDESLASVTVITRRDLERLQVGSLQDALRNLPGLIISNNGGAGKTTSLFLRGTESDHVLVLLDGIKLGSASLGTTSIQDLPIAQIERIEIVRGPRSSLYGSEAIGGVIQVFTRRGGGDFKRDFSLGLGSHASRSGTIGLSGGGDRAWYSANLALSDTKGIDACQNRSGAGCHTVEPDADGYRNTSGSLRGGYRFDSGLEVDLQALRADGENDFDGGFVNQSQTSQQVLSGSLRYTPLDPWRLALTLGRSRDASDNFKDGLFRTTFDTERDSLSLQSDIELGVDRLLIFGFDYQEERLASTTDYAVDSRANRGFFAQYQGKLSVHELQFSLRRDAPQAFASHTTGAVAWGYPLGAGLRLWASYATAFKAPTFNELYYPGFGNDALRPEESASLEFGLAGEAGWGDWSFSGFRTRVDQLIGFDADFVPANIERAAIDGIEAQFTAEVGAWRSSAGFTLLDPRNRSGGERDGNLLPRRPRQSLRIEIDREFGAYAFGMTLVAEGRRYDDLDNRRELGGFGTADLRASYRLNDAWRLGARCENLFDKLYETASFYNQPDRSFYLTLNYQS
ncbi:MAG: TonB-dependent vitamin B12 receptor [Candidatus Thiodiazotropha sp.]